MRQFTGKVLAAGLAGGLVFGGAVLAVADEGPVGDEVTAEDTTTTTAVEGVGDPTTTTTVADEEPEVDAPEAEPEDAENDDDGAAGEHPENHGRYVSQAAHDGEPGPGHGGAVSGVARSSDGMPSPANKGGAAAGERGSRAHDGDD